MYKLEVTKKRLVGIRPHVQVDVNVDQGEFIRLVISDEQVLDIVVQSDYRKRPKIYINLRKENYHE